MKRHFSKKARNLFWTLLPALLWLGATYARPALIGTRCAKLPEACSKESVLSFDQFSMGMENPLADEYSFRTQNFSGLWAVAVPTAWGVFRIFNRSINPAIGWMMIGKDIVTLLQVASWNGFFTEVSHMVSQRARPFVYSDPIQRGLDPAHYTSFYSGHTSFSAATTTAAFLILLNRNARLPLLLVAFACSEALVISTAFFRIAAGRHFLSDVICGAIAGCFIAYFIVCFRNRRLKINLSRWT